MTAPERTFVTWPNENSAGLAFSKSASNRTEYIRADLATVQLAQVRVKPLADLVEKITTAVWHLMDNSETSGPIDDPTITVWKPDFDEVSNLLDQIEGLPSGSTEHMGAGELLSANILAALEPQPDPIAEAVIAWKAKALALWMLLDDIDTQDDASRSNDAHFREATRMHQLKRFAIINGAEIDQLIKESDL